ncbi:MAG: hypothetical protein R3Y63_08910 [Eubacteriales bacterium]
MEKIRKIKGVLPQEWKDEICLEVFEILEEVNPAESEENDKMLERFKGVLEAVTEAEPEGVAPFTEWDDTFNGYMASCGKCEKGYFPKNSFVYCPYCGTKYKWGEVT